MADIFVTDQMKMREVSELRKYGNNPKTHPESQKEKLKRAIQEYGFLIPVVVGKEDLLGDGHLRLTVAEELGMEQVPVVNASHLTPTQLKAFRLAVNRVAESGWDEELLAGEFEALEEVDFSLKSTGFDTMEIEGLTQEPDLDMFFEEENSERDSTKKEVVVCPNCGEEIEL